MTPDTAALRPRSRDLKPGDVLVWTGHPRPTDLAKVIRSRKIDDTGWWMTDGSGLADYVWDQGAAWTTVRALCDAADEVERLRAAVAERDTRLAETIRYHDARVNRADEATDASRTAHAALVAELRALHVREVAQRQTGHGDNAEGIWLCAECLTEYPCRTAALLDRHAPTTGATP